MLQCPTCRTEFVPPPGYLERKQRDNEPLRCPRCHQPFTLPVVDAKEADDDDQ